MQNFPAAELLAIVVFSRLRSGAQPSAELRAHGVAIVGGWEKYSLGAVLSQPLVGGSFMRSAHLENV